jgi:hypothetical protein
VQHTYNILVRIHEDVEAIVFCLAQYSYCVLNPCLIVLARPLVLNGLPGENIAYGVVAPSSEARKVCGGIVQGKGSVHERNIVAIEELVRDV